MKKTLSIFLALVVISSSAFARRAADKPAPATRIGIMKNGTTFRLFYKGTSPGDVKVTIFDAHNKAVFKETLRKVDSFVRPYNFSGLQEGEYTIEVIDATSLQVKKVSYAEDKVENLIGLIRVAGEEDRFLLTVPNKTTETFTIQIFNNDDVLLYKATEQMDGDFSKIYNIKRNEGKLLFTVTDRKGNSRAISY